MAFRRNGSFNLLANRSILGEYQLMTRETHPANFRTPDQQREADRLSAAAMDRLTGTPSAQPLPSRPVEQADEEPEVTEEEPDSSSLSESEYNETGVEEESESEDASSDSGPDDALDVNDPPWKVGQPKSQPLSYWIPSDATGGEKLRTIKFNVDFSDKASVARAVKARQLDLWRAKNQHGLPMARASTQGRAYTLANELWMRTERVAYATANNGATMAHAEFARRYNLRFPNENRTAASLAAHLHRNPHL